MCEKEIEPYLELAAAIVQQALEDYEKALVQIHKIDEKLSTCKLKKAEKNRLCVQKSKKEDEVRSIQKFSKSEWFHLLTNLDGEILIRGVENIVKVKLA